MEIILKSKNNKLIIFSICLLFISACIKSEPTPPDCGISTDNFNNQLQVGFIDVWNTYKIGDSVFFSASLKENIQVVAPLDFNLEIYVLNPDSNQWERVENATNYEGEKPLILNSDRKSLMQTVYFKTKRKDQPIPVFFCISGMIDDKNSETKQTVGASGEFTLHP